MAAHTTDRELSQRAETTHWDAEIHGRHVPGLGAAFLRLIRVLVVGVLLARLGSLARMLALVTPSARRFRSRTRPAHFSELDRFSTI